jgi:hypothetical protein
MLTGVAPFHADTPHGYLMLHASQKPRPLREVNPSVASAPDLEMLLLRALEKDRAKRFGSAREFAQALEAILPNLSDAAGAAPPLLSAAEATEEPTRVVPRIDPNAPTVASGAQPHLAETVPATVIVEPRRRRPIAGIAAVAAAVIAVVVGSAAMLNRSHPQAPQTAPAHPSRANVLVTAPGRLAINAFPWANVTSIRNLATGVPVEIDSPLVTPASPVELAPGRYEITLSNPQFRQPMTRVVEITAGQEAMLNVQFTEPRTARLPVFE